MSFREDLLSFVRDQVVASGDAIREDDPLIDQGLIDSMGLLKITVFIEERTGLRVPDHEVTPDNFQTVADIDRMVARLRAR
jgi:acyl carrier protein